MHSRHLATLVAFAATVLSPIAAADDVAKLEAYRKQLNFQANTQPDPRGHEFMWPVPFGGPTLEIRSRYGERTWKAPRAGGLYVYRNINNLTLLDIYFAAAGTETKEFVTTVNYEEHIRIAGEPSQRCWTPLGPPQHSGPPRPTYAYRGAYFDAAEQGQNWTPNGVLWSNPGYRLVDSIWVFDPPAESATLQIFYVICGFPKKPGDSRLIGVAGVPSGIGHNFAGFEWAPRNLNQNASVPSK